MKSKLFILSICFAVAAFTAPAQYGQRMYYVDTATNESFAKGILSTQNPVGVYPTYVGTGSTKTNLTTILNRSRLVRTQINGAQIFNRHYYIFKNGAELTSRSNAVAENPGLYVMSGAVQGSPNLIPGGADIMIMKTNTSGVPTTPRRIDLAGGFDESLCTISSKYLVGKFISCGYSISNGTSRAFIIKHNSMGSSVTWARYFSLPCIIGGAINNTRANFAVEDSASGNIFVVGTIQSTAGCRNSFLLKLNQAGNYVWLYIYNYPNGLGVDFNSIKPTEIANEFIIAGTAAIGAPLNDRPLLMRVRTIGAAPVTTFSNVIYTTGPTPNYPIGSQTGLDVCTRYKTTGVEYFLCGATTYTFGSTDGHIFKCNNLGMPLKARLYGSSGSDDLKSISSYYSTDSTGVGLVSFGKFYDNSTVTGKKDRSWLVKPYFNLVSGCYEIGDSLYAKTISLSKALYQPAISTAYIIDSLQVQYGNCNQKVLCWNTFLAAGSNARLNYNEEPVSKQALKLFPNPLSGNELNMELNSIIDEAAQVTIYNAVGEAISRFEVQLTEGQNLLQTTLNTEVKGWYIVEVICGSNVYRSKILKQ